MPKAKETRVPLPGENFKKTPQISRTARKAQPLSEEIVTRSDNKSSEESSSGQSVSSADSSQRTANTKTPNPKAIKRTEPTSPPVPSDTSGESEGATSEEDQRGSSPGSDNTNEEEGSQSSESHSQSNGEGTKAAKAGSEITATSHTQTTQFRPARPYEPPRGFAPTSISSSPSNIQETFSSRNLVGKQIWHITVPADVPITSIKEVVLDKVTRGEPVLTHHGVDYGFITDEGSERASKKLLVPSDKGYHAVHSDVVQTLHLQQVVRLPKLSSKQADPSRGSDAAASYHTPAIKSARLQPKGLRMRFRPIGFGAEEPGAIGSSEDEDVDMTDRPRSGFRVPAGIESSKRLDKREVGEVEGAGEVASVPAKRSKKHDKQKNKTMSTQPSSALSSHSGAQRSGSPDGIDGVDGRAAKKEKGAVDNHSEQAHALETAEEKARRKEEKRRKKREKEKLASGKSNGTVAM